MLIELLTFGLLSESGKGIWDWYLRQDPGAMMPALGAAWGLSCALCAACLGLLRSERRLVRASGRPAPITERFHRRARLHAMLAGGAACACLASGVAIQELGSAGLGFDPRIAWAAPLWACSMAFLAACAVAVDIHDWRSGGDARDPALAEERGLLRSSGRVADERRGLDRSTAKGRPGGGSRRL